MHEYGKTREKERNVEVRVHASAGPAVNAESAVSVRVRGKNRRTASALHSQT